MWAFRLIRLLLHLLVGVAKAALLFPLISPAQRIDLIRAWAIRLLAILKVKLEVQGSPPEISAGNILFVANHISWLDIYLLDAVRPVRFVSKAEVRAWPVIGWLAVKVGTIFIERARRHAVARANQTVRDTLNMGDCVAVFPEGTTSDGKRLRPFHASLLQPAIDSGASLWPAAIRYQNHDGSPSSATAYIDDMSFADSLFRILKTPGLIAEITYLEPLPIQGQSRRELAALAETAIASWLNLATPCRKSGIPADPPAAPQ